jgi:hypothetical protein
MSIFDIATREVSSRRFATERFLSLLDEGDASRKIENAICKGLAFIQLYGIYEYSITASVQAALSSIKNRELRVENVCRELLSLIFDPLWISAAQVGRNKLWDKRIELLKQIDPKTSLNNIQDSLFPNDGTHFRVSQLYTIWKLFALPNPIVPELKHLGRISELVENRNAIAHGRRTAEDVGKRYSKKEIEDRILDIFNISVHIIGTLRHKYDNVP